MTRLLFLVLSTCALAAHAGPLPSAPEAAPYVQVQGMTAVGSWRQMPGRARDVTDGWVIGTKPQKGGYGIYRWNGRDWAKVQGGAVAIGGTKENPWVVNNRNQIYRWNGAGWSRIPGEATDVAEGWIISTDIEPGGYGIYRYQNGKWNKIPGGAVRIGGNYDAPWIADDTGKIYKWTGFGWDQVRGEARDVADGWIVSTNKVAGGYGIYRWSGISWEQSPGGAVAIGGKADDPWVVNEQGRIYR